MAFLDAKARLAALPIVAKPNVDCTSVFKNALKISEIFEFEFFQEIRMSFGALKFVWGTHKKACFTTRP